MRPSRVPTIWLLSLYPAEWRARYGDEFAALLEDCPLTPFTVCDVLLGALDARIAPPDDDGRILHMLDRSRRSAVTVFCAYIAFVLAGISYNQSIEDDLRILDAAHPGLALAYHVVLYGSAVALLAVLAGGLPIALAVARRALADRRRDILALLAVPPVALAVWLGWTAVMVRVIAPAAPHAAIHQALGVGLFISWAGLFGLAAVASTAAVSLAVLRAEVDARLYRRALAPATVAVLAMAAVLGGVLAWGLVARAEFPAYLARWTGPVGTIADHWLVEVAVMALATLVAAIALLRGYRAPGGAAASEPAAA